MSHELISTSLITGCGNVAESFGWRGHYVENSSDLGVTLEAAFAEAGPSLIVLPIDYRENMKLTERLGNIACPI